MEKSFTNYTQENEESNTREDYNADSHSAMHTNMQTNIQTGTHSCREKCIQECIIACKCACLHSDMQTAVFLGCKNGFSFRQINLLSIVKNYPLPISYQQIAKLSEWHFDLQLSPEAVRGILQRLKQKKLIETKVYHSGFSRGNLYTCSHKVCSHIPSFYEQISMQTKSGNSVQTKDSLKDRIDSNNLSVFNSENVAFQNKNLTSLLSSPRALLEKLEDEDIAFYWEHLAKSGFRKSQIGQIIESLEKQGSKLEYVMQGFHHAEWDLAHGQMLDKNGDFIKSPTDWVFKILAKQGYYPRPKNYISVEEQAEKDYQVEIQALEKAKIQKSEAAFQNWCASLSEEEKKELLKAKISTMNRIQSKAPERSILKQCYLDFLKSE